MTHQHTVIATALPLFLRYGYRKTSMEDIATATGFSRQSIYSWYPNKKSLFIAVVRATFAETRNAYLEILSDDTLDGQVKVVDAFACYTGFILGSGASVSSMDELVSVSMSFIPEDVERFEQEFLTSIESFFSTRGEYSAAIQTEILHAVSRGLKYSVVSTEEYKRLMSAAVDLLLHPNTKED